MMKSITERNKKVLQVIGEHGYVTYKVSRNNRDQHSVAVIGFRRGPPVHHPLNRGKICNQSKKQTPGKPHYDFHMADCFLKTYAKKPFTAIIFRAQKVYGIFKRASAAM